MTAYSTEQVIEGLLGGMVMPDRSAWERRIASDDTHDTRVVILGGGTGMSSIVGGNPQSRDWPEHPFVGLKEVFPNLTIVVCTTDDGGSTGELLKDLPMIGIGDLRKLCLSMVRREHLEQRYGLAGDDLQNVIRVIHRLMNYRQQDATTGWDLLQDPFNLCVEEERQSCPVALQEGLRSLTQALCAGGAGPTIDPSGHCLGNLVLTSAVFRAAGWRTDRAPGLAEMQKGLDEVAGLIGASVGRLFPATSVPGQLVFRYANGVEVYGQHKSAATRRRQPVMRVRAVFCEEPKTDPVVCQAINEADLIIYAPGSVYTSVIPVLQVPAIIEAIRDNSRALKILGANFWIQEGETDISLRDSRHGFLVSELIEAYDRNVPGGVQGLFDVVLSANLEHMPGNILRNYALEDKRPIHLDRVRVEQMGYRAVEAMLFAPEKLSRPRVIRHDAANFAMAVQVLLYASHHPDEFSDGAITSENRESSPGNGRTLFPGVLTNGPTLCGYMQAVESEIQKKVCSESLRAVLRDLCWANRDVHPAHLGCFDRVCEVPAAAWNRSTEWDNVLGYYDPGAKALCLHEQLLTHRERLCEDLLIALGESLLGNYCSAKRWVEDDQLSEYGVRTYEITLSPVSERKCYLDDSKLRRYLQLARMLEAPSNSDVYRININDEEGFLPPGLLFGLMYAWYLNNAYGGAMEYEMSLLRWRTRDLIPHQAKERSRRQELVAFFRHEVFGHPGE
jgi:uncharacterized cofD-like protein